MTIYELVLSAGLFMASLACQQNADNFVEGSAPAIVTNVKVTGQENNYTFFVTIKSPDTGCDQYANWWEVISADGKQLIYRRILAHSHVDEQPFTRSGGGVKITANTDIIVRAHMHTLGYGEGVIAMIGSVGKGFTAYEIPANFAVDLEKKSPQPSGCAF